MMGKKDLTLRLHLVDILTMMCANYLNLTYNRNECCYYLNNTEFEYHECECIVLKNSIEDKEKNDFIDSILMFGDGTIEFHLKNDEDALNWADFSTDIMLEIIKELNKMLK